MQFETFRKLKDLSEYKIVDLDAIEITPYHILLILLIAVITRLVIWSLKKLLSRKAVINKLELGRTFAIYQILKYFLVVIAIGIVLDSIGVKITLLLAGSAALLVGLGFGIQQIFNDLVSGVLLLFEGTIKVGDIIEVDGQVGRVEEIGIRTSKIVTRADIRMIIPNSRFVSASVVNWTHNNHLTRFQIKVRVAYGSDVRLVKQILIDAAMNHRSVSKVIKPFVRFVEFGEFDLKFDLFFWSSNMFRIENVQSDIRFDIEEQFRKHHIRVPYPQHEVVIRKENEFSNPQYERKHEI